MKNEKERIDYSQALSVLPGLDTVLGSILQDSIMYLCMTDDNFLKLTRNLLPLEFAPGTVYRKMLGLWYEYLDRFKVAPAEYVETELNWAFENKVLTEQEFSQAISYQDRLSKMDPPNPDYVLDRLSEFALQRKWFASGVEFVKLVRSGKLEEGRALTYRLLDEYFMDQEVENPISAESLLRMKFTDQVAIIEEGVLPAETGIILSAEAGIGKSLFRTELAIRLVMGMPILNIQVPQPRNVLILWFEGSELMEQQRLQAMIQGLGIKKFPEEKLFYSPAGFQLDFKNKRQSRVEMEKLMQLIEKNDIDVTIFDPLSCIHTMNENDNMQMRNVLDCISHINWEMGTTSIIVDHFRKPQNDAKYDETPYRTKGAVSKMDWADSVLCMTRRGKCRDKILREVHFVKLRHGPERPNIMIERDPQTFLHKMVEEDVLVPPATVAQVLLNNGMSVGKQTELVKLLQREAGCKQSTAHKAIKRAEEMKMIVAFEGEGKKGKPIGYRLPNMPERPSRE